MTTNEGDKPRDGRGKFIRQPDTAERDAQACRLRVSGCTYQQIADRLGYPHRDLARRAVERALLEIIREPAEQLRQLELERLDEMARIAWSVLYTKHLHVSASGKVARHPDTGEVLIDHEPTFAAMDRLLKIGERRAKLLGLDAPTRIEAEVYPRDDINREIAGLIAALSAGDPGPAAIEGSTDPES